MTRTFNCASCSAPLDFTGEMMQKCGHCGSTVIAPSELFYAEDPRPFSDLSSLTGKALKIAEIQRLIREDKMIHAIKEFRETFGVGLKEAKDAVEAMQRGEGLDVSGVNVRVVERSPGRESNVAEIQRLIRSGQKIQAIKVFRETFGVGLKEAKDAVEAMERGKSFNNLDLHEIKIDTVALKGAGRVVGGTALIMLIVGVAILGVVVAAVAYFSFSSRNTLQAPANNPVPVTPPSSSGGKGSVTTELLKFGGDGVGQGQFKDNRSVAVDGKGRIYSSDYTPIRVQVFDADGKFINQIKPEDGQILYGLVADKDGSLFVATERSIYKFEGETGKQIAKIGEVSPRGMALSLDGKIVVADDGRGISVFDRDLKRTKHFKDATQQASSRIGFRNVAVGTDGTIFVTERTSQDICRFSPEGKFLNRFPSQLSSINALAVDHSGRLFVSSASTIKVFDHTGTPAGTFDSYQAFGMAFTPEGDMLLASRPFIVKYRVDL